MKLTDHLKQYSRKKLSKIADRHQIYYGTDFSKLWITDKIKKKLLDKEYITKIINEKLNSQAVKTIKQLINKGPTNKNRLNNSTCSKLKRLGLIYQTGDSYQIPQDIKQLVKDKIKLSSKHQSSNNNPSATKNLNFYPSPAEIEVKQQVDLSFYDYVILTLSHLKKHKSNSSTLKEYLNQLNFTLLSNKQLLEYILTYCRQFDLLTPELKLTSNPQDWLNLSYPELILQSLDIFYPKSKKSLRQIIAILIHYPPQEDFTVDFLNQELDLEILTRDEDKELLQLLKIFLITETRLKLTPFCWHLFNSQFEKILNKPQVNQEKIIVNPPIPRQKFWEICNLASLVQVNKNLIFETEKTKKSPDVS